MGVRGWSERELDRGGGGGGVLGAEVGGVGVGVVRGGVGGAGPEGGGGGGGGGRKVCGAPPPGGNTGIAIWGCIAARAAGGRGWPPGGEVGACCV